jgi:hypothetical protein
MSTDQSTSVDHHAFWKDALAGKNPDHTRGKAECGYYRMRQRDGSTVGIAIWRDDEGGLCAKIGKRKGEAIEPDREEEFCDRVFAWCLQHPVTEESYWHWYDNDSWPEDLPDVEAQVQDRLNEISESFGHNAPPELVIKDTVAELRAEAEKWLKDIGGEITTQAEADKAANFADRFGELEKEAEKTRVGEKEPHLKASRDVDAKWQPIKKAAENAKRWAKALPTEFFKAELARKSQELAAKAAQGEAVKPADLKVKAGTRGRGVSLRTTKVFRCTDFGSLLSHYLKDERFKREVAPLLARLAEADLKAGHTIPGAVLEDQQSAA